MIGLPIAFSLGWAGVAALALQGKIPLLVFPQRLWTAIDSLPLLSILFFVIAGELMLQGGISKRLINFVMIFFGWIRGSLAVVSILSCALFGAISGSALATTAAIGSIMYPEMLKDEKYDNVFSATLQAVGGTLGTMIPPSITLILYANITNTSIADLFVGVLIPGFIMALMYIVAGYIYIFKRGYDKRTVDSVKQDEKSALTVFLDGIGALLMPMIILGGIYAGIFTPTESAIVACVYAMFVGFFVYKELNFKILYEALIRAAVVSATIMILVATASFFGWVMAIMNIPSKVMAALNPFMSSKITFLLMINVVFLICGMFMDTSVIVLLLIPLVYKAASDVGINLIHFGVIACINLSMGMVTPPFGTSLFVASNMTSCKIEHMYKEVILYCICGVFGILAVTYFEQFTMLLVSHMAK
jgi:C4-dicarboxylate transporter DctM subunit